MVRNLYFENHLFMCVGPRVHFRSHLAFTPNAPPSEVPNPASSQTRRLKSLLLSPSKSLSRPSHCHGTAQTQPNESSCQVGQGRQINIQKASECNALPCEPIQGRLTESGKHSNTPDAHVSSAFDLFAVYSLIRISAARNARSSPLLRLPSEIRSQKGHAVEVKKAENIAWLRERDMNPYLKWAPRFPVVPAASHVPEVWRQIYSETVLTSYRHSVFFIASQETVPSSWSAGLLPAQRTVVTRVQIGPRALRTYLRRDPWTSRKSITHEKSIRSKLPNLRTILISHDAMRWILVWFLVDT